MQKNRDTIRCKQKNQLKTNRFRANLKANEFRRQLSVPRPNSREEIDFPINYFGSIAAADSKKETQQLKRKKEPNCC